jgi:hypothetical protein
MVVVEIAILETRRKLLQDIRLWLDPARGKVNVVIAIEANPAGPIITIDKYEWDQANGQPTLSLVESR